MESKLSAVALAGAVLLGAGCSALKPVPDTTRYYTLVPAASGATVTPAETGAARIGVRVSVQTEYLRRPPIAVRIGANELRFADDHRWAERVDEAVERALTFALQQRQTGDVIVPVTNGPASGAAAIIDVAIAACEGTADGAMLEGFWKINTGTGVAPAATGHFRRTRAGWDGADYGQLAGLLGALVDELAAEIAPAMANIPR